MWCFDLLSWSVLQRQLENMGYMVLVSNTRWQKTMRSLLRNHVPESDDDTREVQLQVQMQCFCCQKRGSAKIDNADPLDVAGLDVAGCKEGTCSSDWKCPRSRTAGQGEMDKDGPRQGLHHQRCRESRWPLKVLGRAGARTHLKFKIAHSHHGDCWRLFNDNLSLKPLVYTKGIGSTDQGS